MLVIYSWYLVLGQDYKVLRLVANNEQVGCVWFITVSTISLGGRLLMRWAAFEVLDRPAMCIVSTQLKSHSRDTSVSNLKESTLRFTTQLYCGEKHGVNP